MPTITASPTGAQWRPLSGLVTIVSGTVSLVLSPSRAGWATPTATITLHLGTPAHAAWQAPAPTIGTLLGPHTPLAAPFNTLSPGLRVRMDPDPAKAQWVPIQTALGLVSGTLSISSPLVHAAERTPTATVDIILPPAPGRMQAQTPGARIRLPLVIPPTRAQWSTPAASLQVAGQGRMLPALTLALARIAAGLPLEDPSILPPEYRG